jgi:hypothetical protein
MRPLNQATVAVLAAAFSATLPAAALQDGPTPPEYGPYAAILCHFSDEPPNASRGPYEFLMGSSPGGFGSYIDEVSYGQMRWDGSDVYGWYALPHDRAWYQGPDGDRLHTPEGDRQLLTDCFAAADADIHFPDHAGMIVQVHRGYGNGVASGGRWILVLDGEEREYGMFQLRGSPPSLYLFAHEIGHPLGMLHGFVEADVAFGPMQSFRPQHYLGPQKIFSGWIGDDRTIRPPPGVRTSVFLERVAQPLGSGPILAEIPGRVDPNNRFFLEARVPVGVDSIIDAPSILLTHTLHPPFPGATVSRAVTLLWSPPAVVGRMYGDSTEGLFVRVDSVTPAGMGIAITRGWPLDLVVAGDGAVEGLDATCDAECLHIAGEPGLTVTLRGRPGPGHELDGWGGDCAGRAWCAVVLTNARRVTASFLPTLDIAPEAIAQALLGGQPLDTTTARRLDERGNANRVLDLGDLRAWVMGR